MASARNPAAVF